MMQTSTGMPPLVNGSMQVVGTVTADGSGLDEWEQTATGHVGLSMVGGRVNGKALEAILGRNIPMRGTLALRCFGAHMQLTDGLATIDRFRNGSLPRPLERTEETGLEVCRSHHCLCVHAGDGTGQ